LSEFLWRGRRCAGRMERPNWERVWPTRFVAYGIQLIRAGCWASSALFPPATHKFSLHMIGRILGPPVKRRRSHHHRERSHCSLGHCKQDSAAVLSHGCCSGRWRRWRCRARRSDAKDGLLPLALGRANTAVLITVATQHGSLQSYAPSWWSVSKMVVRRI
jgi:hypothetical protein